MQDFSIPNTATVASALEEERDEIQSTTYTLQLALADAQKEIDALKISSKNDWKVHQEDVELRKKLRTQLHTANRSVDRLNNKIKFKSRKPYQPKKIGFYEDMSQSTQYRRQERVIELIEELNGTDEITY